MWQPFGHQWASGVFQCCHDRLKRRHFSLKLIFRPADESGVVKTMAVGSHKGPMGKTGDARNTNSPNGMDAVQQKTPQGVTHGRSQLW
jgi:hypothetical protein